MFIWFGSCHASSSHPSPDYLLSVKSLLEVRVVTPTDETQAYLSLPTESDNHKMLWDRANLSHSSSNQISVVFIMTEVLINGVCHDTL